MVESKNSPQTKKTNSLPSKRMLLAFSIMGGVTPAFAVAPDVTEVVAEYGLLAGGPILAIGTARATVQVAIRGWKIVGRMI